MRLNLFLLIPLILMAGIEDHYQKLETRREYTGPKNIDYIYLINLKQRPERWINSLKQLVPYNIIPQRFPGIYGWSLGPDVLNDISLKFTVGMWAGRESVMVFPPEKKGEPEWINLSYAWDGKSCFSGWTVKGTIGCSLSHLSVLHDAYEAGYQTIWVLEDDFRILDDPHKLSSIIEELDRVVGVEGWDVLYTDFDFLVVDVDRDILDQVPALWRPDMPYRDISHLGLHIPVSYNLSKIGGRSRAHSIIYRRSGIEKILEFYRENHNFLPYDQELPLIPDLNFFVVNRDIISFHEENSDTRYKHFSTSPN